MALNPWCIKCRRVHKGDCDQRILARLKEQKHMAAIRQRKLYSLCRDFMEREHPSIFASFAKQVGIKGPTRK